jgi:prolyl-tRNA editing enzyme YbaK/EbsC (Cys-tRNA(Pro) deacylase)
MASPPVGSGQGVPDRIRAWLTAESVSFREVHHAPTRTSEESAHARGEALRVGGKALLIKVDDVFRLFVLSAARKLDSPAVKRQFAARKTRFATPEELRALTGLEPGSVPPFGSPILPFPLYVDPSVFENERIAFNAGSLTHSIVMAVADYRRLATPEVFPFST